VLVRRGGVLRYAVLSHVYTVTVSAPAAQGGRYTFPMIYEAGHWKHQPSDEALSWMGLGANAALTALRNAGSC
jgi:hypothetical protein